MGLVPVHFDSSAGSSGTSVLEPEPAPPSGPPAPADPPPPAIDAPATPPCEPSPAPPVTLEPPGESLLPADEPPAPATPPAPALLPGVAGPSPSLGLEQATSEAEERNPNAQRARGPSSFRRTDFVGKRRRTQRERREQLLVTLTYHQQRDTSIHLPRRSPRSPPRPVHPRSPSLMSPIRRRRPIRCPLRWHRRCCRFRRRRSIRQRRLRSFRRCH